MKKTLDLPLLIPLVLGISFLLAFTFLHWEGPMGTITLTGKVECVETDDRNDISLVTIATQVEDYLVDAEPKGEELIQLVNRIVQVKGRVTKNEHGQKTIRVSEYKMVPQ